MPKVVRCSNETSSESTLFLNNFLVYLSNHNQHNRPLNLSSLLA